MADVAELVVKAGYDGADLTRGLTKSASEVQKFGQEIVGLQGRFAKIALPALPADTSNTIREAVTALREFGIEIAEVQTKAGGQRVFATLNKDVDLVKKSFDALGVSVQVVSTEMLEQATALLQADAAIRSRIQLLQQGAQFNATEARSLKELRTIYAQLSREVAASNVPFERRIALERELAGIRRTFATINAQSRVSISDQFLGAVAPVNQAAAALNNVRQKTETATRSFQLINRQTGEFTQLGRRASGAAIGIAFGLEALARGGTAAEGGLRTALRAVAGFAAFFGPKGLIISGVAAATAAIIDLFRKSREEMERTQKAFSDSINEMIRASDREGLKDQLKGLVEGLPTLDLETGTIKMAGGIKQMVADSARLVGNVNTASQILAKIPGFPSKNTDEFNKVTAALTEANRQAGLLQKVINALPQKLPEVKVGGLSNADLAKEAFKRLQDQVEAASRAAQVLTGNFVAQRDIGLKMLGLHDQISRLLDRETDKTGAAAVGYADMLKELEKFGELQTLLLRRKFPVIPEIAVDAAALRNSFEKQLKDTPLLIPVTPFLFSGVAPLVQAIRDMPPLEVPVQLRPEVDPKGLQNFTGLIEQIKQAQGLLDFSQLTGDKKFISEAERNLSQLKDRVKTFAANLQQAMQAANVPLEEQRRIMAAVVALTGQLTEGAAASATFADNIHAITSAGRGLLSIADNMGRIDDQTRQALESVLALADAVALLNSKGGLAATLGGAVGLIGGAIGLLQAIGAIGQSPAEQERNRILRANNDELARLRLEISGFADSIGEQLALATNLDTLRPAIDRFVQARDRIASPGGGPQFRDATLALFADIAKLGLSLQELAAAARLAGIEILDSQGRLIPEALKQWSAALKDAAKAAVRFGDSFDEAREARNLLNRARGVPDTPAQQIADNAALFEQFSPKLWEEFFSSVDFTNDAATRAAIDRFLTAWLGDKIPEDMFEGLKPEEIRAIVTGWLDSMDAARDALDALTESLLNVPRITKIELARFNATLPFVNPNLVSGLTPPNVPVVPSPLPPGVVPSGGGVQTIVHTGDIYIDAKDRPLAQTFNELQALLKRKGRQQRGLGGTTLDGLNN